MLTDAQIGALGSGAGSILSGAGNIISTALANRANRKLAEYSYDQQRQMIAEQNAYNSPVQQMARYAEAGLNPHLIFGSPQSAGNQSQIARYDAPRMEAPDVQLGLDGAMQMALAFRQFELDQKEKAASIALKEEQAYAQKQLALGYQQDYYQKQIETAVKSFQAGLQTPSGVWSQEELNQIREGKRMQLYDLGIDSAESLVALREAQTDLSRLNYKEQEWVLENLRPAELRFMQLRSEGMTYDNAIQQIEAEYAKVGKLVSMGNNVARTLISLVAVGFGLRFGRKK